MVNLMTASKRISGEGHPPPRGGGNKAAYVDSHVAGLSFPPDQMAELNRAE